MVVALELAARRLGADSGAAGAFANRDRTAAGQPHPAAPFLTVAAAAATTVQRHNPDLDEAFASPPPAPPPPAAPRPVARDNPDLDEAFGVSPPGPPPAPKSPILGSAFTAADPTAGRPPMRPKGPPKPTAAEPAGYGFAPDPNDVPIPLADGMPPPPPPPPETFGVLPAPDLPKPPPPLPGPAAPALVAVVDWKAGVLDVAVVGGGAPGGGQESAEPGKGKKEKTWQELFKERQDAAKKEPKANGWATVGSSAGAAILKAFAPVVGPMMAFGAVLSQTNSGMSTFQKAVNVMAATLAPILLPPMVLLAAGILTLSDIIWSRLSPNLAGWAQLVTTTLVPAIESAAESLADLVDAIAYVVEVAKNPKKLLTGTDAEQAAQARGGPAPGMAGIKSAGVLTDFAAAGFNPMAYMRNRFFGNDATSRLNEGMRRGQSGAPPAAGQAEGGPAATAGPQATRAPQTAGERMRQNLAESRATRAAPPAPGAAGGGMGSAFGDNLNLVMASMQRAMGPKMEIGTAASAARNRQLAAGGDPLDFKALMRMLESMRETFGGVKAGVDRLNEQTPTPQQPPRGS